MGETKNEDRQVKEEGIGEAHNDKKQQEQERVGEAARRDSEELEPAWFSGCMEQMKEEMRQELREVMRSTEDEVRTMEQMQGTNGVRQLKRW